MSKQRIEAALAAMETGQLPDAESVQLLRAVFEQLTDPDFFSGAVAMDRAANPDRFKETLEKYRQLYLKRQNKNEPLYEMMLEWKLEAMELILRGVEMSDGEGLSFTNLYNLMTAFRILGRRYSEQYTPEEEIAREVLYKNPENWGAEKNYHGQWDDVYVGPEVRRLNSIFFSDKDLRYVIDMLESHGEIILSSKGKYNFPPKE